MGDRHLRGILKSLLSPSALRVAVIGLVQGIADRTMRRVTGYLAA